MPFWLLDDLISSVSYALLELLYTHWHATVKHNEMQGYPICILFDNFYFKSILHDERIF